MKQKGSITAYLCLMLTLMLSLITGTMESVRISHARVMASCAMNQGLYSLFAQYDRTLLEQYELFFVNGGYQNGVWQPDRLCREIRDTSTDILAPSAPGAQELVGCPGRGEVTEVYLSGFRVATDDEGTAFTRQICEAMKSRLGTNGIQQLSERLKKDSETADLQKEKQENFGEEEVLKQYEESKSLQEGSEETKGEGNDGTDASQKQTAGTSEEENFVNPIEVIQNIRKMGLLGLVLPDGTNVSEGCVDLTQFVSERNLQTGFGMVHREKEQSYVEKLLLSEYLLWKFPCFTDQKTTSGLSLQLEYSLIGKNSDRANLLGTVKKLMVFREGANLMYLLSDTQKQGELDGMAVAIAAAMGIPGAHLVIKTALMVCWAFAESVLDVRELLDGGRTPLIKSSDTWQLSLKNLPDLLEKRDQLRKNCSDGLDYRGYLQILLLQNSFQKLTYKCMDLVEYGMRTSAGKQTFRLDCCVDELEAGMKMKIGSREYEITRSYGYQHG